MRGHRFLPRPFDSDMSESVIILIIGATRLYRSLAEYTQRVSPVYDRPTSSEHLLMMRIVFRI